MVNARSRKYIEQETDELWNILLFALEYFRGIWNILKGFGIDTRDQLNDIPLLKLCAIIDRLEEICPDDFWKNIPRSTPKKSKSKLLRKFRKHKKYRRRPAVPLTFKRSSWLPPLFNTKATRKPPNVWSYPDPERN